METETTFAAHYLEEVENDPMSEFNSCDLTDSTATDGEAADDDAINSAWV